MSFSNGRSNRATTGLRRMLRNPALDGACFHEFGSVVHLNPSHDIKSTV